MLNSFDALHWAFQKSALVPGSFDFYTAWRVENQDGLGPYTSQRSSRLQQEIASSEAFYSTFKPWPEAVWTDTLNQRLVANRDNTTVLVDAVNNALGSTDADLTSLRASIPDAYGALAWLSRLGSSMVETLVEDGYNLSVYFVSPETYFLEVPSLNWHAQSAFYEPLSEKVSEFDLSEILV